MKTIYLPVILSMLAACGNVTKKTNTEAEQCDTDIIYVNEVTCETEEVENKQAWVSEDGRMSIQTGRCPDSGTSPDYWVIWSIVDDNNMRHEIRYDRSYSMRDVHAIRKSDGSTYYIVDCYASASSTDGYNWLEAYRIVGDSVNEVNVIDGGKDIGDNPFHINYYIPYWYFTTNGFGYDWLFEYDKKTGNLYVPMEENWRILDRYQVWHFNGDRFVCMGEQPHKDMDESVGAYNRLICYFKTKDYIVRVDSLDSHELRYASWKLPKTMADCPDIIITGGKRQKYPYTPDGYKQSDDYRFTHGSYEYIVNFYELTPKEDGHREHHNYLIVKKGDEVVVKQEGEKDI